MAYCGYDIDSISNSTHLVPFSKNYKIEEFDSGIKEYNDFLMQDAEEFEEKCISKTQLLLENKTGNVIGYFSLCSASIRITKDEKSQHHMDNVMLNSIPALKIGKLAVSKTMRKVQKGYGSYLIELVRGIATEINENGLGCRFVVVDADVENNPNVNDFYGKNGFTLNESYSKNNNKQTVSMRMDIFEDEEETSKENAS